MDTADQLAVGSGGRRHQAGVASRRHRHPEVSVVSLGASLWVWKHLQQYNNLAWQHERERHHWNKPKQERRQAGGNKKY